MWFPYIPQNWSIKKLNHICTVITDYVASGSFADLAANVEYLDEPNYAMLIRTTDISDKGHSSKPVYISEKSYQFLSNSNLFGGEILLPNIGASVGDVYIVPRLYEKMSLAPNSIMLKTEYVDKYFYYFFFCDAGKKSLLNIAKSTAQPKFNKTDLRQLKVIVPPIDEQHRIADFLDRKCAEIDRVLEKTRASIEEYKKLKQSVITQAVTKGIRGEREMKDSGIEWIGEIPIDWEFRKIKHSFYIVAGATPKSEKPEFWDGDICWITPADYKTNDKYIVSGRRNISVEGLNSCGTTIVPKDSIVFSKRAPIGSVAITAIELCTNQGCLACVTKASVNVLFFYYLLSVFSEQFELFGSGTTFKEISTTNFANFVLPYPSLAEQIDISTYLDRKCSEIDTLISKKEQLITELEAYKKSLIYEYVTGKKEVIYG